MVVFICFHEHGENGRLLPFSSGFSLVFLEVLLFVLVVCFTASRGCYPFFSSFFFRVFFIFFCFQVVCWFVMGVLPVSAVASLCEMSALVVA